jgi:HK97 gp10 family phage protein
MVGTYDRESGGAVSKVRGLDELKQAFVSFAIDMDKAIDDAVYDVANQVRNTAIKSIQKKSSGKKVRRKKQGGGYRDHIAAAAGEAPNTDNGDLVRSIAVEHVKFSQVAYVGTNLDYGAWLEFGTKQMKPRPWLEPAKDENINNFKKAAIKAAEKQVKKAGQ